MDERRHPSLLSGRRGLTVLVAWKDLRSIVVRDLGVQGLSQNRAKRLPTIVLSRLRALCLIH